MAHALLYILISKFFVSANLRYIRYFGGTSVTSVYQETAGLNKLTFENWENY